MDYPDRKIRSIAQVAEEAARARAAGGKVVLCHGEFDLFHPGHLRYLKGAKKEGDFLIVTLTPDRFINRGPDRPVFNELIRAESVAAVEIVDLVAINEWPTAVETLRAIRPDVYCKGAEYLDRSKDVTGRIALEEAVTLEIGARLHFVEDITFSSSGLLNKYFQVYPVEAATFLKAFAAAHPLDELTAKIRGLADLSVLIVGDTIVDEYYFCEALGKSPKSTNITTRFLASERFAGGALATANHVAEYCENVALVTRAGDDPSLLDFIRSHLNPRVRLELFAKKGAVTTVKRRFVEPAFLSKMFEICYLDDGADAGAPDRQVLECAARLAPEFELVIANDFGHGLIGGEMIEQLTARSAHLAVSAQTNSANLGHNLITKYGRADYVCIDEPELRLAWHDRRRDIRELMRELYDRLGCATLTITRGHKGAIVYSRDRGFSEVPVLSTKVVDTVGAGDAFFSVTAPLERRGLSPEELGFVGNAVGALAVQIVCNRYPVTLAALCKFITAMLK